MRHSVNTSRVIRLTILALCFLVICNFAFAQKRPEQNIRRAAVTTQYVVVDGNYKNETSVIKQEIYDSLGRCHTEIDWSPVDHYPHNYRWYTFSGKLKVKTESFINEKLASIEEYSYNNDSLLVKKITKNKNVVDTNQYFILNYKYNSQRNPILITAKTPKGKTAYISKSTFDAKGKELTREVKVKKRFFPVDSIIKMIVVPSYDSIGRLISEQITSTKIDKSVQNKSFKYKYDKKNRPISIQELDPSGKQIRREERQYQPTKNRVQLIKVYDNKDILVKMYGKYYQHFPTKNRRDMEIEY